MRPMLMLFALWTALLPALASAQAIAVPPGERSSETPTMTFLFETRNAKLTLLFIPGGEGHFGIQPDWTA